MGNEMVDHAVIELSRCFEIDMNENPMQNHSRRHFIAANGSHGDE